MDLIPAAAPHLSVSVVLHNSSLCLLQCALRSLQKSAVAAAKAGTVERVSVRLVDNASAASYQAQLTTMLAGWPVSPVVQIECSWLSCNRGYGHGHNTAITLVDSDYHLVLNPDVELAVDALQVGLSFLQANSDVALLSPKARGADGSQEFLCKRYPSALILLLRGFAPKWGSQFFDRRLASYEMRDVCSSQQAVDIPIASGCFMLARTAALRAVEGFDAQFFLYFEDFDLSLRLQDQGRVVFDPAMQIVHHGGYAARKGWQHLRYFATSGVRFFNRHGWRWI